MVSEVGCLISTNEMKILNHQIIICNYNALQHFHKVTLMINYRIDFHDYRL